jgi:hypothetical protein
MALAFIYLRIDEEFSAGNLGTGNVAYFKRVSQKALYGHTRASTRCLGLQLCPSLFLGALCSTERQAVLFGGSLCISTARLKEELRQVAFLCIQSAHPIQFSNPIL